MKRERGEREALIVVVVQLFSFVSNIRPILFQSKHHAYKLIPLNVHVAYM